MSAKKSKKNGKAAPEIKADMEPTMSNNLSDAVVKENSEKKGAGGGFLSSAGGAGTCESLASYLSKGSLI